MHMTQAELSGLHFWQLLAPLAQTPLSPAAAEVVDAVVGMGATVVVVGMPSVTGSASTHFRLYLPRPWPLKPSGHAGMHRPSKRYCEFWGAGSRG